MAGCCLPWEEEFQRLVARVVVFTETPRIQHLAARAARVFASPERAKDAPLDLRALRYPPFMEWFLQDFVAPRRTAPLLGEFADQAEGLSPREDQVLLGMLLAPTRAYEAIETPSPRGMLARDLLTGSECPIGPLGLPEGVIRSDICVCRLVPLGRLQRPGFSLLRLPPGGQAEMLAYLRATYRMARHGRHLSLEDYLDGGAYLYHQFFLKRGRQLGGRADRTCRWIAASSGGAIYQGRETRRIRAALDRQPELERVEENGAGALYHWIDSMQGVRRGTVRLERDEIHAAAETREDLKGLQGFLDSCLRGLIQLTLEPQIPVSDLPSTAAPAAPAGTAFLRRVVARWPDTPMPLVGDRTPREVCRSRAGQELVTPLLLGFERNLVRQKRLGRAWVETKVLWEELGLAPTLSIRGQASPHGR
jgi:hypothetical protein